MCIKNFCGDCLLIHMQLHAPCTTVDYHWSYLCTIPTLCRLCYDFLITLLCAFDMIYTDAGASSKQHHFVSILFSVWFKYFSKLLVIAWYDKRIAVEYERKERVWEIFHSMHNFVHFWYGIHLFHTRLSSVCVCLHHQSHRWRMEHCTDTTQVSVFIYLLLQIPTDHYS